MENNLKNQGGARVEIMSFMKWKLARRFHPDNEEQKANLSKVRHFSGKDMIRRPDVLNLCLCDDRPDNTMDNGDEKPEKKVYKHEEYLSRMDKAILEALQLYAYHQKGNEKWMHCDCKAKQLGQAAADWVYADKPEHVESRKKQILKRFSRLFAETSLEVLSSNLRGVIDLLSDEGIPLDYRYLAYDIYRVIPEPYNPERIRKVWLGWSKDFTCELDQLEREMQEKTLKSKK